MATPPPHMLQAYTPPLSLWKLVEQHVVLSEQDELKSMLGVHIVDQSLELHSEIEMLLDIWRDIREEQNDEKIPATLPEPPNLRECLIQEINFFVQNVKEKAEQKGIDPEHILKHHNRDIIDYASDISRPGSSVGHLSRLSDGRETPMMITSPDRVSSYEVSDEIESVNDKLNVNEFDKVCIHLRETLEKEVEQLLNDLEFLQGCLDEEADVRDSITTPRTSREPTITELREERASLEKEMLLSDNLTSLPEVHNRAFAASTKALLPSKISLNPPQPQTKPSPFKVNQNLHRIRNSPRETTAAGENPISLSSGTDYPLKASHDIFDKDLTQEREKSPVQSDSISALDTPALSPTPPTASRSDSSINQRILPKSPAIHPPTIPKSTSHERPSRDVILRARINQRHKTPSPSRIRVVNVNSIVDIRTEKKETSSSADTENQYNFATTLPSSFSMPLSATNVPDQSLGVRPSSADKFRKMVMGCRDGE